jgi:hypothetical protein
MIAYGRKERKALAGQTAKAFSMDICCKICKKVLA